MLFRSAGVFYTTMEEELVFYAEIHYYVCAYQTIQIAPGTWSALLVSCGLVPLGVAVTTASVVGHCFHEERVRW